MSDLNKKVICPASYFAGLEGGKTHKATQREIKNHGGVCKECQNIFKKKHLKAMRNGQSDEPTEDRHYLKRQFDAAGTNADTRIEGSYENFEYESIAEPEERNIAQDFATAALKKFALSLLIKGKTPRRLWITLNALCFAAKIHPMQGQTMEVVSKYSKTGLGNFSLEANYWHDLMGLPAIGGGRNSQKARQSFSKSAKIAHAKRGHKATEKTTDFPLLQALSNATRHANRNHDHIRCMTPQRRQELIDRLKPLSALQIKLEQSLKPQQI